MLIPMAHFTVVVPYRNRLNHLAVFAPHMERILQSGSFRIVVIEQADELPFNRGALLNIGFVLVRQKTDWVVFHDVDMLPLDNSYNYGQRPATVVHLASCAEQFNYTLPYRNYIGGVLSVACETFEAINGYSNKYWGWGGEDDDLYVRLWLHGIRVTNLRGLYRSLKHARAKTSSNNSVQYRNFLNIAAAPNRKWAYTVPELFRRAQPDIYVPRPEAINESAHDGLSSLKFTALCTRPLREFIEVDTPLDYSHEVVTVSLGLVV